MRITRTANLSELSTNGCTPTMPAYSLLIPCSVILASAASTDGRTYGLPVGGGGGGGAHV
jgi:hypothetical protein